MNRFALLLLLLAAGCNGCEMWSTYAREHRCVEVARVADTCWMANTVGFQDVGGVLLPITIQVPYSCESVEYRCDGGKLVWR